jgi:hypothetical protein
MALSASTAEQVYNIFRLHVSEQKVERIISICSARPAARASARPWNSWTP